MKLKTLKDFDFNYPMGVEKKHELRKEAIKYIFDLREHIKNSSDNLDGAIAREIMGRTILFIKHFFNITEEDLK